MQKTTSYSSIDRKNTRARYDFDSDSDTSSETEQDLAEASPEVVIESQHSTTKLDVLNTTPKIPESPKRLSVTSPSVFLTEVALKQVGEKVDQTSRSYNAVSNTESPWVKSSETSEHKNQENLSRKFETSSKLYSSLPVERLEPQDSANLRRNNNLQDVDAITSTGSSIKTPVEVNVKETTVLENTAVQVPVARVNNLIKEVEKTTHSQSATVEVKAQKKPSVSKKEAGVMDTQTKTRIRQIEEEAETRVRLARDQARVSEQIMQGHMIKTEAAAQYKLQLLQAQLDAAQQEALKAWGQCKELQAQAQESETAKAAEIEKLKNEVRITKGAIIKEESVQQSRLATLSQELAAKTKEAQDAQAHCSHLSAELESCKAKELSERERANTLEKISSGHAIKTEAMAQAKSQMLQTQLNQANGFKLQLESQLASSKKDAASKVSGLEEQLRKLRADFQITKAQIQGPGVKRAQDLHLNLTEMIENSWVVLCWQGKEGEVVGRAITLYPSFKRNLGAFAALAAIFCLFTFGVKGGFTNWKQRIGKKVVPVPM